MTPQQWQEIDRLFQHAVELNPKDRDAFLNEACKGNRSLREEVDSLLVSDAGASNFIDQEVLAQAAPFLAVEFPRLDDGQKLGNYEIVCLIGRGGMGEVYLAQDEVLNRRVALKLLPADYTNHPERLRRFQQEAFAVSALNHPNILTIHELRQVEDLQFIATEFVDGETLRERMNRERLAPLQILDIAVQLASAMTAAHEAGMVHRDIKPENIMLRRDGYVKVLDFGLAKLKEYVEATPATEAHADVNTSSALVMGTVRYMSPEQAQGFPVDPRSDIFSMGVVLFEMVAGHAPFHGKTVIETVKSVVTGEPPWLALDGAAEPLVRIIRKALAKNPDARYRDAQELLSELTALKSQLQLESGGFPGVASRPRRLFHDARAGTARWWATVSAALKSHKLVVAFVSLALAIGIVALVYTTWPEKAISPGTWSVKTPLDRPRAGAAVATLNGNLYVASGNDRSGAINELDEYDPATGKWTSRAPIPTARTAAGAAGINGKLYVFGGCTHNSDCRIGTTNVLEVYDPTSNSWSVKSPMPTARSLMASAVIAGKLYVAGGRGPCPPCSGYDKLEIYDPITDKWDTTKAPLPTAHTSPGGAGLDGKFYVVGGVLTSGEELVNPQRLAMYDPATDKWSLKAALGIPRSSIGLAAIHGQLYAIGGVTRIGSSTVVEAYDPASDQWLPKAPIPAPRSLLQPVAIDGIIYLVGGGDAQGEPVAALDAYTAVCPGSECASTPPGLVGWWPGDGDTSDLAGFNSGSLFGSVKFEQGKVDQAFSLDGSSFVTVGNPAAVSLVNTQMTMDGWIKPRVNAIGIYFGKTEYGKNPYLLLFSRGVSARFKSAGQEVPVHAFSDFPSNTKFYVPPIDQWTHIALTYDGEQIRIYVNGTLMGQAAKTGNIDGDNVPFNIGGRADDQGTGKFNGLIDEVELFNRALSAGEIRMIFEAGGDGQCKPRASCR
ncbi:MAG TPA: protein kinase [Pyrinomonadaceae bacterium]|nr:protein kinase [Pyrinomonadaceae bacterium]